MGGFFQCAKKFDCIFNILCYCMLLRYIFLMRVFMIFSISLQFRVPLLCQKDLDTAINLIDANSRASSLRIFLTKYDGGPSSPLGPPPGRLKNLFEKPPVCWGTV